MGELELTYGYDYPEEMVALFTEYTAMLVRLEPPFQAYLDLQHYEDEVRDLTVKYGLPDGRLYLARMNGKAVGCIALRKLDDERCELKRLYVRPEYRNQGIATTLIDQILSDARSLGYQHLLLDTMPGLTDAIQMYRNLDFREIPRYNDSPLDTTLYMGLDL